MFRKIFETGLRKSRFASERAFVCKKPTVRGYAGSKGIRSTSPSVFVPGTMFAVGFSGILFFSNNEKESMCEDESSNVFSMYSKCEMKLLTGNAHPVLAKHIGDALGINVAEANVKKFKNGETRVSIKESVRDCDCFIVQPTCSPAPNDYIVELLIMIDTLRRAGAARITVIMPYFGYARDSHKQKSRTPITAKVLADVLEQAGVDRVVTVDLHASQIQGFANYPIDNLTAIPILRNYLLRLGVFGEDVVVLSSSPTHAKMTEVLSKALGSGFALSSKVRDSDEDTDHAVLVGDVAEKTCVVVSDMVDTANTFCRTARIARENGAKHVVGLAVHGIFSGEAVEKIDSSALDMVIVSDTIPCIERTALSEKVVVLSTATLLAHAIWRIHMGGSLSQLFKFDSAAHIAKPIAHTQEGEKIKRILTR